MSTATAPIEIPFPSELGDDEQFLEEELIDYFDGLVHDGRELGGPLLAALCLEVDDHRVEVYAVEIVQVDIDDSGVMLHYGYQYTGYAACKDIDLNGDDHGTAYGKRVGSAWIFEPYEPPERLSPSEEF